MENKNLKTLINVFVGMVGFGLGLAAVSLFLSVVDVTSTVPVTGSSGTMNASLSLFDADWDMMDASPAFLIISFLVLLSGLIIMALDASFKQKLKKNVKFLNYIALALSVVGLVLLIVSAIVTVNDVEDSMMSIMLAAAKEEAGSDANDKILLVTLRAMVNFKMGTGAVMAILGGVIAVVGSVMLVIPTFNPIKLAVEPAPAAPVAEPAQPVANEAVTTDDTTDNHTDTIA